MLKQHTRAIDVHVDWFIMILGLQVEQLGHNQTRVLICHLKITKSTFNDLKINNNIAWIFRG